MCVNPFFSIIIPFHNDEDYLENCLHSLAVQNFKCFEVLMVNNNSVDNSVNVCKKYVGEYTNYHLLYQQRPGTSAARNLGMANAKGKYILFVDADDFVEETILGELYEVVRNHSFDIVCFNMNNNNFLGSTVNYLEMPYSKKQKLTRMEAFRSLILEHGGYRGFVWNKLYSKSIIGNTEFNEQIQYLEDTLFNIELIRKSHDIYCFPVVLTNYRIHKDSFVNKRFNNEQLSYLSALDIAKTQMPVEFLNDLEVLKRLAQIKFLSETIVMNPTKFSHIKRTIKKKVGIYRTSQFQITRFQADLLKVADYSLTMAAVMFKFRSISSKLYHSFLKFKDTVIENSHS